MFAHFGELCFHLGANPHFLFGQHFFRVHFGVFLRLNLDTGEHVSLGLQLLLEHAPRVVMRLGDDRRLHFGSRTLFNIGFQQGFHLGTDLRLDFHLQLMTQIALCGFEFMLLPLGSRLGLHPRLGQRTRLGLGARTRFRERLCFGLGCGARGGQCLLLLRGFRGLLAGHLRVCRIGTVALLFFFDNRGFQCDPCRLGGGLRTFCLPNRPLLGVASRPGFNIEPCAQLRLTFGARTRFGLRLLACQRQRGDEFGVVGYRHQSRCDWLGCLTSLIWRRCRGAFNLAARDGGAVSRRLE